MVDMSYYQSMTQQTDEQLVQLYRNGDRSVFDVLVQRYARSVYYFIYGYVRDVGQAEDSTQDTFVKIWKHLGRFDKEKKFKTWLFSIAKNTALDVLKKKKTIPFSLLDSDDEEYQFGESIVDPEAFLEDAFEKKENTQFIAVALAALSPPHRSVLFLHYMEGLTFREIAEVLSESIDTIKSRHRRALLLLQKTLLVPRSAPFSHNKS